MDREEHSNLWCFYINASNSCVVTKYHRLPRQRIPKTKLRRTRQSLNRVCQLLVIIYTFSQTRSYSISDSGLSLLVSETKMRLCIVLALINLMFIAAVEQGDDCYDPESSTQTCYCGDTDYDGCSPDCC